MSKIEMLGHKINRNGIFVLQGLVDAIHKLPEPTSIGEKRHSLGLINFQRRFVKNAAKILSALTKCLQGKVKNDEQITLAAEAKKDFVEIETALAQAAFLAHFREDDTLRLCTDVFIVAMGETLAQKLLDNIEQASAYFSKVLDDTPKHYSVFNLELLAVQTQFDPYLCWPLFGNLQIGQNVPSSE